MDVIKATLHLGLEAQTTLAISADGVSQTYYQLLNASLSICKELSGILPIHQSNVENGGSSHSLDGARIGIIAKPSAQFVAGLWATWLSHSIAVPLAVSHPEAELLHVLNDADVSIVLGTADYKSHLQEICKKASCHFYLLPEVQSTLFTDVDETTFRDVTSQIEELSAIPDETPGLIIYTSGTTGRPKGAVHTHYGMNSQVKMLSQAWEYTKIDRFLNCLPLHHVHGLFNSLLAPLFAGAIVEFLPKFSVKGVWKRWSESYPPAGAKDPNAITVFTGVPTMYAYLLQGYKGMDEESQRVVASAARQLRLMMSGSSALPRPVMNEWEELTGHKLLERYGMTEFVMAISNPYKGKRKAGTVGKPLPGVQVKIVDEDAAVPGVGELYVKSPSLFKEYWRRPEATKEAFEDGYFRTGDSVTMDEDGYFVILGRSSVDILKVGGYKLSALEIEAVLLEHPAIAECAILGLPDKYYGEVICAVVVVTDEAKADADSGDDALTLTQLQEWAKERLAPYKIPTVLKIWDAMPRNAMGKVNKKDLRKMLTETKSA